MCIDDVSCFVKDLPCYPGRDVGTSTERTKSGTSWDESSKKVERRMEMM